MVNNDLCINFIKTCCLWHSPRVSEKTCMLIYDVKVPDLMTFSAKSLTGCNSYKMLLHEKS